ncbi:MAG: hypothetical protein ABI600_14900 [Luteolibacter sp.]
MKINIRTTLAGILLIGVGGFVAGRVSSSGSAAAQAGPAETRAPRSSSQTTGGSADAAKSARTSRSEHSPAMTSSERLAKLESIMRGENALDRNRVLLAYIDQLGPGDFEGAVAHFREMGLTDQRTGEYALLLSAWAGADPTAALAYAKENTRDGFAADTILTTWASADPDSAIRWAKSNFDGEGANPYLAGIIRGIAASDPARATELLASMPRSEERAKGLDAFLPHLLEQGAEATRAWIAGLTDDSLKNGAMMRSTEKLAATDPAGTASWLLANPGEAAKRRMDDVYSTWAQKDQQAALNSFTSLPAGENRSNALRGVITSMAVEDPKAAVSMLDRYPNDVTDKVVQSVIWHSFGSDPSTAASQIARISDEGQRNQMYRRAIGSWLESDPAAAQAWMRTNPLPQPVRDLLGQNQSGASTAPRALVPGFKVSGQTGTPQR